MGGSLSTVFESEHDKERTIIFEFPSSEKAKDWFNGEEYGKVKHLCDNTGSFGFVLIDSY